MENWKDVADRLRDHREPYKLGAWEKFESKYLDSPIQGSAIPNRQVEKVRPLGNPWKIWSSGVAAAVLLLMGVFWLWPGTEPMTDAEVIPELVQSELELPVQDESPVSVASTTQPLVSVPKTAFSLPTQSFETEPLEISPPSQSFGREFSFAGLESIDFQPSRSLHHPDRIPSGLEKPGPGNVRSSSAMAKEKNGLLGSIFGNLNEDLSVGDEVNGARSINRDKWALGLSVASMITSSEEMNVGGGISVAYKLSDRLFVRSGISLARLGVSTSAPGSSGPSTYVGYAYASNGSGGTSGPAGPQGPTTPGKTIESVASVSPEAVPGYYTRLLSGASSNLLTVDIPLDLKYFVTNKIYTSVGVSFLGILNENRTNHYIDKINQPLFNGYSANGQDMQYAMKTLHINEASHTQPLEGNGYAGYLNFSIGRQTRISNKFNLAIEPFFKLPVGKLMQEEMNMANGGIRIVTGF